MINFRYHLVSLIAVFLALAIGIVAGSTVIKESILDQTQQNLDRAEQNLKDLEDTNNRLQSELERLRDLDTKLANEGPELLLQNRLSDVPVLMVSVEGADGSAVAALRDSLDDAQADVAGTVTFSARLTLGSADDIKRVQEVLGVTTVDPIELRRLLADRFADQLLAVARPVVESTETGSENGVTTTRPVVASAVASASLREFLDAMEDKGLVSIGDRVDSTALADLAGLRVVVMSGAGAKLDNTLLLYPFLERLADGPGPTTVTVEATQPDSEVERGSFVGVVRNDGRLRDRVSSVDNVEDFPGWAATVLALQDLAVGRVGHYGVGSGASGLLPAPTP